MSGVSYCTGRFIFICVLFILYIVCIHVNQEGFTWMYRMYRINTKKGILGI